MFTMNGITISEGVSEGQAFVLCPHQVIDELEHSANLGLGEELSKYRVASREFASKLQHAMSGTVPDKVRDIFGAVAAYITNQKNIQEIEKLISLGTPAAEAAQNVLLPKMALFEVDDDDESNNMSQELGVLMRDFIASINASSYHRIIDSPQPTEPCVLIASDLTPARFLSLHTELIRAVVLEDGHASSHLSTVLRDLRIPAVFDVKGVMTVKNGEHVLVDATRGAVLVEPPQDTARALIARHSQFDENDDDEIVDSDLEVTVAGSMGAIGEIDRLVSYLNHGLGLLRTEFLFLSCQQEPSCKEMLATFSSIFSRIPPRTPLTIRTFDFAGDKKPLFNQELDEAGALRNYGAQVGSALLRKELRAILIAAVGREVNIVFPLITQISEAKALTDLLDQVIQELDDENIAHGQAVVALMIETPAAVLSARGFAAYGEMFLIGTSSLAEYASAPRAPSDYFTPALSKMVAIACKAAHRAGVRVGIAGRFTMKPELLPFFLAMGSTYFTTDATAIFKLRKALQRLAERGIKPGFDDAYYDKVMEIDSGRELQRLLFQDQDLSFAIKE